MSQVYISYSRADRKTAEEIVSTLENRGISCWRDCDIETCNFWHEIGSAIRNAQYFIVLVSEAVLNSKVVYEELDLAIKYKKTIILLKLDDVPLPDSMNFYFSHVHILDYTREKMAVLEKIITHIKASDPIAPAVQIELPKHEETEYDVFVSHSTANDKVAESIVAHLEKQGISCWIAPRDTRSHTTYPAQITQAVRNCPVFLLLVSEKAMDSSHVEREISLAIDKNISPGYKYIIPLMLEDCTLTDEFCYYLANLHYYAYHRDTDGILAKVTEQIHHFIEKDESSVQEYLVQARKLYEDQRYKDAFFYFQKAARLDNVEAQGMLGYCYHTGKGCDKNIPNALMWYQKAVKGGDVYAEANMALCYIYEGSATQNLQKAAELFRSAAQKGHAGAQRHLGNLYEKGNGVAMNLEMAKKWYEKSAAQGDEYAKKRLQELS